MGILEAIQRETGREMTLPALKQKQRKQRRLLANRKVKVEAGRRKKLSCLVSPKSHNPATSSGLTGRGGTKLRRRIQVFPLRKCPRRREKSGRLWIVIRRKSTKRKPKRRRKGMKRSTSNGLRVGEKKPSNKPKVIRRRKKELLVEARQRRKNLLEFRPGAPARGSPQRSLSKTVTAMPRKVVRAPPVPAATATRVTSH